MIQQTPTIQPTDAELLMRFSGTRDDDAFRLLVERHAGLVWTVCRRVLGQRQDVEDAFQATFLVLARQADSIRSSDSVASWLFKVAHRTAVRAARESLKRAERPLAEDVSIPSEELAQLQERETFELLAAELNRLPENYRAPLILFYLEGKSRQATADELDVSDAALKARLARGRQMLRRRLMRRGVALSLTMAAVTAAGQTSEAALSAVLIEQTTAAGLSYAATGSASAACSAEIVSLAKGVQPMLTTTLTKSVLSVGAVLTAGLLVAVGVGSHSSFAGAPKSDRRSIDTTISSVSSVTKQVPVSAADQAKRDAADLAAYKKELQIRAAAKKLQSALKETTDIDFGDVPIQDAMKFVASLHNITVHLNEKVQLQELKPITLRLSGISLESALTVMLKPLGLTYKTDRDVLRIVALPKQETAEELDERTIDLSPRSEAERAVEASLEEKTEFEFVDTPLRDVMGFFADQHDLEIVINQAELTEAGVGTDEPITARLREGQNKISFQSGLNIVLKPLGLTYLIEDEVLKITTMKAAATRKEARAYSVKSLVDSGFEIDALQNVVKSQAGGEAQLLGKAGILVVTAPQQSHRKILKLLEQLQRAAGFHGRQPE